MQTQMTLDLGIDERVDVRSLIVHGDIERDTPKAKREQPAPEFERVLMDGVYSSMRKSTLCYVDNRQFDSDHANLFT